MISCARLHNKEKGGLYPLLEQVLRAQCTSTLYTDTFPYGISDIRAIPEALCPC